MTDITELARRVEHIISDMKLKHGDKDTYAPVMKWDEFLALVEALEKAQATEAHCNRGWIEAHEQEARAEAAEQRIAELENNEIQEEGNQFLVVRHPDKVPVIKHPVGELEDYLRQIFKADPLATIDIVTHRYYGVGGQFVKDADEYLHEMSIKVEAE